MSISPEAQAMRRVVAEATTKKPIPSLSADSLEKELSILIEYIHAFSLQGKCTMSYTFSIFHIGHENIFHVLQSKLRNLGYDVKFNRYDLIGVYSIKW